MQIPTLPAGKIPAKNAVSEINQLHEKITANTGTLLADIIQIGERLTAEKAKLEHGQWLPWLEKNVHFDRSTAARYMRVFERRKEIKCSSVLHLTEAYRLLSDVGELPQGVESAPCSTANVNSSTVNSDSFPAKKTLAELEAELEASIPEFSARCLLMREYRDQKLYAQEFTTFEAYCKYRHGLAEVDANLFIGALDTGLTAPVADRLIELSSRTGGKP